MVDLFLERAKLFSQGSVTDDRIRLAFASGAVPHTPLTTDLAMASIPKVKHMICHGFPPNACLREFVKKPYEQISSACVPYSTAAMMSILHYIDRRQWVVLGARECYSELGGSESSGMGARETLDYCQRRGMKDLGSGRRFRIGSYAWAQARRPEGIDAIKAAVAACLPCVVGMFMPTDYSTSMSGTCDDKDVALKSYHQVCVIGYDEKRFYFVDSQRFTGGRGSFGSFLIDALKHDKQKYFAYACTVTDRIDESLDKLVWNFKNP